MEIGKKLISNPTCRRALISDENLIAICIEKDNVLHNQSIFIGSTWNEIAKQLVQDFHYNFNTPRTIQPMLYRFNDGKNFFSTLLDEYILDNDSLIYDIEHSNICNFINYNISEYT